MKKSYSFKSWWKNVFWFHYKGQAILAVLLIAFTALIISDFSKKANPDFTLVVGTIDVLREEDMREIKTLLEEEIGDANGDGKTDIRIEIYIPSTDGSETGTNNLQALDFAFIGDPEKVLFLFDEELTLRYEPDYFEKLSDYGIRSEKDPFYPVNELPVFQRMLVVETPFYLTLKGWKLTEKDNPDYIRTYDLAVGVIERFIEES